MPGVVSVLLCQVLPGRAGHGLSVARPRTVRPSADARGGSPHRSAAGGEETAPTPNQFSVFMVAPFSCGQPTAFSGSAPMSVEQLPAPGRWRRAIRSHRARFRRVHAAGRRRTDQADRRVGRDDAAELWRLWMPVCFCGAGDGGEAARPPMPCVAELAPPTELRPVVGATPGGLCRPAPLSLPVLVVEAKKGPCWKSSAAAIPR